MVDLGHWSYVGVLLVILAGCLWLEVALRTRVLRRWKRLVLSMMLPVVVFVAWDAYAIAAGHWNFDVDRILGLSVVAGVPIDEVLFFICIPLASILTLEAVRSEKPHWPAGDES